MARKSKRKANKRLALPCIISMSKDQGHTLNQL